MGKHRIAVTTWLVLMLAGFTALFADQELVQDDPITILPGHALPLDCDTILIDRLSETPAVVACATPTPEPPTPTPEPTFTPLPTATPVPMIEGVPICLDHDPTKWHALVERDGSGAITCAYGHEHGDNPHDLDDVFGAPGAWANVDQEISYPWQTSSSLGLENAAKHNFYKWYVGRPGRCLATFSRYGFSAIRAQAHSDGSAGATTRFHSFSLEAVACDPQTGQDVGHIRTGGHLDYGPLCARTSTSTWIGVPLANFPDPIPANCGGGFRRMHGGPASFQGNIIWYGGNTMIAPYGIDDEDWGPIDPNDPTKLLFYGLAPGPSGPQTNFNHSAARGPGPHLAAVNIVRFRDAWDGQVDGRLTLHGFTDRNGLPLPGVCGPLGPDCVPLDVDLLAGEAQYRADAFPLERREYDVNSPVTGKSLIRFPN